MVLQLVYTLCYLEQREEFKMNNKIIILNRNSKQFNNNGYNIEVKDYFHVIDVIRFLTDNGHKINFIIDDEFEGQSIYGKQHNEKVVSLMDLIQIYDIRKPGKNVSLHFNVDQKFELSDIITSLKNEFIQKMSDATIDFLVPILYNTVPFNSRPMFKDPEEMINKIYLIWEENSKIFKNKQILVKLFENTEKPSEFVPGNSLCDHLLHIAANIDSIAIIDSEEDNKQVEVELKDEESRRYRNFDPDKQHVSELLGTIDITQYADYQLLKMDKISEEQEIKDKQYYKSKYFSKNDEEN